MKRATFLMGLLMALTFAGCAWDNENVQRPNGGNTFIDPAVDSDNDTISDYDEGILVNKDTDGDTLPDYLDMDSDGDTIGDAMDTSPQGGDDSKIKNGEACQENSQCQSGNCFMNQVCRTASWKNADNMACQSNEHCASNLCVSGICKSSNSGSNNSGSNDCSVVGCSEPYTVCRNKKCISVDDFGDECEENEDCKAGKYCCNGFCMSSLCEPGITCAVVKNYGAFEAVFYNDNCASNCVETTWGYICGCSTHEQCGNGYFCSDVCEPQRALGVRCSNDIQCTSGKCIDKKCAKAQ